MASKTFYEFAITNIANHLKSDANKQKVLGIDTTESPMNAFQASEVLAIVFCKKKEEIMLDIVSEA